MVESSAVIAANWISFLVIAGSFVVLCFISLRYKGPGGNENYYNGFREQNMLTVIINLWCALAYFAKVLQSHSDDDGFVPLTKIPYLDYATTCPLLTLDLMWCLDAPYKITSAVLVFTVMITGVACSLAVAPYSFYWFAMGMVLFIFTYVLMLSIVRERLEFITQCAHDSNAKRSIKHLKAAVIIYFGIWPIFAILWLLSYRAANVISNDTNHILHCILDVIAKSCFGFVLLHFKMYFDKKLLESGVHEDEFAEYSKEVSKHREEKPWRKTASSYPESDYDEPVYMNGEDLNLNDPPAWGGLQASAASWEDLQPANDREVTHFNEFCRSLPKKMVSLMNDQTNMYNSEDKDEGNYLERAKVAHTKTRDKFHIGNGNGEKKEQEVLATLPDASTAPVAEAAACG
ncbi:hypothetical protein GUITHDRAFT_120390 [Guillardia theta CCMP2712]|uniref:Uncharacterized protein n=2 Tax=Guillardia theta TaxID=55529 RepID=L1IBI6_GUITC|nr:hypothetical protein GUITHDRAFT_120390 [Guillardia theta CCMP2712]EKX33442.1 hypothetical protein GUITHDRAFT_120390 [Guillardia theta CCMP2712]|eukprot:XP_005820422.1 hypothetical protein GUITHDRAFT_120390 [Guillardia theta CCMP2712]